MDKLAVSIVEYTNSLPFVWGLESSDLAESMVLTKDNPAVCAEKLITGQAAVGLVPVATLSQIPNARIIGDYCIGADGPVHSVFLFSHVPIHEVKRIRLDNQSRTSNQLTRVLAKHFWNITPEFSKDPNLPVDAFVEIGDRTFGKHQQTTYVYDLAEEWKKWMGLPFVFAVWVANQPIQAAWEQAFNDALKKGLDLRKERIPSIKNIDNFDIDDYLHHKIRYELDDDKKEALLRFLALIEQ